MKTLLLCAAVCCALPAGASRAAGPKAEHPLVGVWEFTLAEGRCTETYLFKADGTSLVTSGDEVAESRYEVSPTPSAKGFYKLVDTVTQDNGKKDCGGGITAVGHRSTNYLLFHPSRQILLMCQEESLDACFGPLVRVPAQDV